MHYIVTFETNLFDLNSEKENPINPIHGLSVGEWIVPLLKDREVNSSPIEPEDWGWFLNAEYKRHRYMLGFIALESENDGENLEVIIHVDKKRTLLERILMKNKMQKNDELLNIVEVLSSQIPNVSKLETLPAG